MSPPSALMLLCHPATPAGAARAMSVRLKADAGALAVTYRLEGALDRLRLPPPGRPARRDRLWEHTCFELFLGPVGEAAYCEFNFAPSGEWAAYRFERYREGASLAEAADPGIAVGREANVLELAAAVPFAHLPFAAAPLRIAVSAVVEEAHGARSYWALRHPAARPDFHHPDAFALRLTAQGDVMETVL